MATLLVLIGLIVVLALIVRNLVRTRKRGSCVGCPGCTGACPHQSRHAERG